MRIDKYLWCIRSFKTRSQASTACRENRILVNDEVVKPSREIKVNETISIRKGAVTFVWKVLAIPTSRLGPKLVPEYAENRTPEEELFKLKMIQEGQNQRPKGLGRPTKRDRRDWNKLFGNAEEDD